MYIKETLNIDGLHYILKFEHFKFSFYLDRPPRARLMINYRKHPELALFRDDPIYEDINQNLPAIKILNVIQRRIDAIIHQHHLNYWTFSATSSKKANVYEKLLQRWIKRQNFNCRYDRVDDDFYVYMQDIQVDE